MSFVGLRPDSPNDDTITVSSDEDDFAIAETDDESDGDILDTVEPEDEDLFELPLTRLRSRRAILSTITESMSQSSSVLSASSAASASPMDAEDSNSVDSAVSEGALPETYRSSAGESVSITRIRVPPLEPQPSTSGGVSAEPSPFIVLRPAGSSGVSPGRKRKREDEDPPTHGKVQLKSSESEDDDFETCSICFEDWSNAGDHRVASLKCGHLFGHCCIHKWLAGTGKKCPQCNEPAKQKDVRVLYCKRLKAIDTAERDRALQDLEDERKKRQQAEAQIANLKVSLEIAKSDAARFSKQLEQTKQQRPHLPNTSTPGVSSTSSTAAPSTGVFTFRRKESLGEGGCRLLEFCRGLNLLVVSRQQHSRLFPGFGVQIIQADFTQQKYVPLHTKQIKCLSVNERSHHLLSVSLDKQIKITSLANSNPIASYTSGLVVWSCCWDIDDENVFYAGLASGVVHVYDLRRRQDHDKPTENFAFAIPNVISKTPVVSVQHVPADGDVGKGLLVGHLDGKCVFYKDSHASADPYPANSQEDPSTRNWTAHVLPLEGSLTTLSLESTTCSFLASFRPSGKYPRVRHVHARLGLATPGTEAVTIKNVKVFEGGSSQKVISKSSLFLHPNSDAMSTLVCAGDEEAGATYLWNAVSGRRMQAIQNTPSVLDVNYLPPRNGRPPMLALLSDKALAIYDYKENQ